MILKYYICCTSEQMNKQLSAANSQNHSPKSGLFSIRKQASPILLLGHNDWSLAAL